MLLLGTRSATVRPASPQFPACPYNQFQLTALSMDEVLAIEKTKPRSVLREMRTRFTPSINKLIG
jgi:hypothetical protein